MRLHARFVRPVGAALFVALLPLGAAAWAGCGGGTPLGGPYGGTTNPTPPDTMNTSEPSASGGSSTGADE
jgi:hypothetical protein